MLACLIKSFSIDKDFDKIEGFFYKIVTESEN